MVKNLPVNAGDVGSILGLGRSPGEGNGNPALVFLPEKSHGQRSLAGSMGHKELDTTEQLRMHAHVYQKRKAKNGGQI